MTLRIRRNPWLGIALLLGAPLASVAGCDGDSPSAPPRSARLESRGAIDFSCGVNCSYEGEAVNQGVGCATRVRGITRLLRADGSELSNDDWQLAPERVIGIGEAFLYGDCCFAVTDVSGMGSYRTEAFWDDVPCP